MELLQSILDNSSTPALTAFVLGLLTAISPCPLATNIAAIGFIGKNIEDRKAIFTRGIYYTLGRILAYTILGVILISILKEGVSMFGIQKAISKWGEILLGPVLLIIGLFMLFGDRCERHIHWHGTRFYDGCCRSVVAGSYPPQKGNDLETHRHLLRCRYCNNSTVRIYVQLDIMKILVLCTGNSCRSQMAHGF